MSQARIFHRGHRPYDAERLGTRAAAVALARHSFRRIFGYKHGGRMKVIPGLLVAVSTAPAIAIVGIVAFAPGPIIEAGEVAPTYHRFVTAVVVLFAALAGSEVLCTDRRTRTIGLYLASPLTPQTYLAAKASSAVAALSLITVGPPMFMLVGLSLQGAGPDGLVPLATLTIRIVVAGVVLSVFYASVSLAVSSLTDRRGLAAAAVIGVVFGTQMVTRTLTASVRISDNVLLGNLIDLPAELVYRVYGERGEIPAITTWVLVVTTCAWIAAAVALTWERYRHLRLQR